MPRIKTDTLAQHRDWRRSQLLDEPLSAQDVDSRQRIIELLKKRADAGSTIVVVAHSHENDLSWADKVIKNFL